MDDKEFYAVLNELGTEEELKQSDTKRIIECPCCSNNIYETMGYCPFCGEKLKETELVSHQKLVQALEEKKYSIIWEEIQKGSLDAQKIFNDYIIDVMRNARTKQKVQETFQLIEPYTESCLYARGLYERAVIEVNRDRGLFDVCEIYRDSSLKEKAVKKQIEIAEEGDPFSLYFTGIYLLNQKNKGKDKEKAYRYLYQAARQGHHAAKARLAIENLEGECSEKFLVGDSLNNLLEASFCGNNYAKKILKEKVFLHNELNWESDSITDVWGKENVKYIRQLQEFIENHCPIKMKYPPIIASEQTDNTKLLEKFLDENEKKKLEERIKREENENGLEKIGYLKEKVEELEPYKIETEKNILDVAGEKEKLEVEEKTRKKEEEKWEAERQARLEKEEKAREEEKRKAQESIDRKAKELAEQKIQEELEQIKITAEKKALEEARAKAELQAKQEAEKALKKVDDEKRKATVKEERKKNPCHLAILSFICSILSWPSIMLIYPPIPLAIAGIVMGIKGKKSEKKKLAMAGIVIGSLLILLYVVVGIAVI